MQKALEMLGYSCWHSIDFFKNPRDMPMWIEALDAKYQHKGQPFTRREWDQLLSHYSAVSSDSPAIGFAEELITAYPDAKVILHEREIEGWYRSFDNAIIRAQFDPFMRLIADLDRWVTGPVREVHFKWVMGHFGMANMKNKQEMREKSRSAYRRHNDLVRRVCPPERMLEFKIKDGWEPLCRFLGKDIPKDEKTGEVLPFPRINDQDALKEMLGAIAWQGIKNFLWHNAIYIVALVLGLVACWYAWSASRTGR